FFFKSCLKIMETHNLTSVSEFHLLGFSEDPDLQPVLFGLFLSMYLVTVLGNLLIILAVSSDSHLHTPMYFFLSTLSFDDICLTSSTVPKLIAGILTHSRVISYVGCLRQMSFFILFECTDSVLLTVMAYDRFVAICHPLHYAVIMNPRLCVLLVLFSVFSGLLDSQFDASGTVGSMPAFPLPTVFHMRQRLSDGVFTSGGTKAPKPCLQFDASGTVGSMPAFPLPTVFHMRQRLSDGVFTSGGTKAPKPLELFVGRINAMTKFDCVSNIAYLPYRLCRCLNNIEAQNQTSVSEFHLMALSEDPNLQPVLFGLFLSMYLVTVLGNLLIILAVSSDSHLHTPMYFFLSNLSYSDIFFISTTVPKMIVDIQTQNKDISYMGCLTQMSLFIIFICLDDALLTVMAYDRFVAICHPLRYRSIMNHHLCGVFIFVSFLFSLLISQLQNLTILHVTYFKGTEIANFFCHPSQLLNLSCSDAITKNIVMYFVGAISGFLPLSGIFFSYYKIVTSIMKIPSSEGKYKAFSTCGSHLTVVCLFYGTAIGDYLASAASNSPRNSAVASLMYTVFTPMLNPFIYSLRNKDIKSALWRTWNRAK
ncbi:Olfactory receptor 18, partial [Fukomys damarensis]